MSTKRLHDGMFEYEHQRDADQGDHDADELLFFIEMKHKDECRGDHLVQRDEEYRDRSQQANAGSYERYCQPPGEIDGPDPQPDWQQLYEGVPEFGRQAYDPGNSDAAFPGS